MYTVSPAGVGFPTRTHGRSDSGSVESGVAEDHDAPPSVERTNVVDTIDSDAKKTRPSRPMAMSESNPPGSR